MSSRYVVYFGIIILAHDGVLISLTYTADSPRFLLVNTGGGPRPPGENSCLKIKFLSLSETHSLGMIFIIPEV